MSEYKKIVEKSFDQVKVNKKKVLLKEAKRLIKKSGLDNYAPYRTIGQTGDWTIERYKKAIAHAKRQIIKNKGKRFRR